MGRKPGWMDAVRSARADWELRTGFPELHEAASAWQDTGDIERLERALDALEQDTERRGYPPLGPNLNRAEQVVALAARIVTTSQIAARLRLQMDAVETMRGTMRDELAATLALAASDPVTSYHRKLAEHLEAEGIVTADLHPVSRELGRTVAGAIRQLNTERRGGRGPAPGEDYADHSPVATWADLPRSFAGFELVDVAPGDAKDDEPTPLPPSTDIAFYTTDRRRPDARGSRRETLMAWLPVIKAWCRENELALTPMQQAGWAMLLMHRIANDASNVSNMKDLEIASPWSDGGVVRVVVLPPPSVDD